MATSLTQPPVIGQPFASSGDRATLPETTNAKIASLAKGFPPETSVSPDLGGAYPRRPDFNALGYLSTALNFFLQNGGVFTFDATVSSAITGYPAGARLWAEKDGKTVIVESLKDNNEDNFVSNESYIGNGTSWAVITPGDSSNTAVGTYSANTVYQNTTGRKIMVVVRMYSASGIEMVCSIGATSTPTTEVAGAKENSPDLSDKEQTVTFVVPAGYYFKIVVSSGSILRAESWEF